MKMPEVVVVIEGTDAIFLHVRSAANWSTNSRQYRILTVVPRLLFLFQCKRWLCIIHCSNESGTAHIMQRRTRDGYNGAVTSLHVDRKPHGVIGTSAGLGSEIYVEILHIKFHCWV